MVNKAEQKQFMHFPAIKTSRTPDEQAEKVIEEVGEFRSDLSDIEAVDVLQTAETLIRLQFEGRMEDFERVKRQVREKNDARGYYTKGCH